MIAIVALVVVGPKNLPVTLRAVGRAIREFQRASRELREQAGFDEVVDEVTRPLREGLSGIEKDVLREESLDARVDTGMEYPEAAPDDYGALPEGSSWYPEEMEKNPDATPAVFAPEPEPVQATPAPAAEEPRS